MATGAAIGVGAVASAGAAAAAIRAARMKTNPRQVTYGGSQDAQDALLGQYASGIDQGNQAFSQGVMGLGQAGQAAQGLGGQGQQLFDSASSTPTILGKGTGILGSYVPGQVAATQQQQALDQGALQNLGAARAGGALGLRNALVANAGTNVQAAGQAAVQRAQEQQAYVGAQVAQANQDRDSQQLQQQRVLQQQQVGLGAQAQGISSAIGAAGATGQLGLGNQGQYLGQQQNVYDTQNDNAMDYEQRRQANQQRKSQNAWNMASGLASVAGRAFGSMGGGG